jgi:hypothetical protein
LDQAEAEEYLDGIEESGELLAQFFAQRAEQRAKDVAAGRQLEGDAQAEALQDELTYLKSKQQLNDTLAQEIKDSTILTEKQKQEALKELGQQQVENAQAVAEKEQAIAKNNAEVQKRITDAKFAVTSTFVEGATGLMELLASSSKEAEEIQKVAALGQIAIDTAKAISNLTASSTAVAGAVAAASGPLGVAPAPRPTRLTTVPKSLPLSPTWSRQSNSFNSMTGACSGIPVTACRPRRARH